MTSALPLRPLAAVSAVLALGLLAGSAPATAELDGAWDGHMEVTAPGATSRVTASAVGDPSDYSFLSRTTPPARWDPCEVIDYKINLAEGPKDALALVLTAVEQVEQATGLVFRYRGTSSFIPTRGDTTEDGVDLSIAYVRPAATDAWGTPAPAGVAGMSWRSGTTAEGVQAGRALDGRVVLNADDFDRFDGWIAQGLQPRGVHYMARQVVQHELGHAIGLSHASATGGQVMAPGANPDGKTTGWGAGDLAGLRLVGAEQGCLRATAAEAAAATRPAPEPDPVIPAWQPLVQKALGTTAPAPAPAPAVAPAAPAPAPAAAPVAAPVAAPAPARAVAPVRRPAAVRGPAVARRGTTPVLTVTGTPRAAYVLHVRSAGSRTFSAVHRSRLDAAGRAQVALRTPRDVRYYAVVAGTRTAPGLTQLR